MRSPVPIQLTRAAGSGAALVAGLALLVAAPSASAQGGGVTAPHAGRVPAPDPAPGRAAPEPDAAPGADSVEAAPSPQPPPAPTAPDTGAPVITPEPGVAAAQPPAGPRHDQSRRRARRERAARQEARDKPKARQRDRRSTAGRADPTSVFGLNVALVGAAGSDTQPTSPPVELIAWALLALVLAAAALLTLTARVARMEGLTASMPQGARRLQRILESSRFSPPGRRRRPAS